MKGGPIGKRYAKALLNLATEASSIEAIGEEVQEIAKHYEENASLKNVILEPKLSKERKIGIINEITKGYSEVVNRYCRYLVHKDRFKIIADISSAYTALSSAKLGKATANVVVAYSLTQAEQKKLQKQLSQYTGKKVTLSVDVDKSILGGAITSIDSLVLDGSIKNRLNLIRETISKGK